MRCAAGSPGGTASCFVLGRDAIRPVVGPIKLEVAKQVSRLNQRNTRNKDDKQTKQQQWMEQTVAGAAAAASDTGRESEGIS